MSSGKQNLAGLTQSQRDFNKKAAQDIAQHQQHNASRIKDEAEKQYRADILELLKKGISVKKVLNNINLNSEVATTVLKVLLDNHYTFQQIFDGGYTITQIVNVLTSRGKTPEEIAAQKTAILKQLIDSKYPVQQIFKAGYTTNDILQFLISLKYTPEQVFNSGYEITYGEIKLNLKKFQLDPKQNADFNTWENSIEGSGKCKLAYGFAGSKSDCYIDTKTGLYSKKGGRRKCSVRRQYRRSRKVSRK